MKPLRVLITGGRSQLGRELKRRAPRRFDVVALARPQFSLADPASIALAIDTVQPDWIINASAYTAVDKAESEPEAAFQLNHHGVAALAEIALRRGARLVHISTDFVFDGTKGAPYLPDDAPNPLGVYGASKLAGEDAARAAGAAVVRTAWLYSAHGKNFVRTVLHLLQARKDVRVVADQVGTPTSAASLASMLWRMVGSDVEPGSVWHYTDAGVASWYDFALAVRECAGVHVRRLAPVLPIRTVDYPTPARRPLYSVLDKTATWERFGGAAHWREPLPAVVKTLLKQARAPQAP